MNKCALRFLQKAMEENDQPPTCFLKGASSQQPFLCKGLPDSVRKAHSAPLASAMLQT
jgi:hypothetical protein